MIYLLNMSEKDYIRKKNKWSVIGLFVWSIIINIIIIIIIIIS